MSSQTIPVPTIPARARYHVLTKPIGASCNLNCSYCYYKPRMGLPEGPTPGRMTDETLATFIKQYIEGQESDEIIFSWQGGEATLLGLDYFKKIIELQRAFNPHNKRIENDLQTNGSLLNESWCEFLQENRFLVGLSSDGPPELHDAFRRDQREGPTSHQVVAAAALLHHYKIPFNTLTVVQRENSRHPQAVYRFLRDVIGSTHMQFIPCAVPHNFAKVSAPEERPESMPLQGTTAARPGYADSYVTSWSVDPDEWGDFLIGVFDEWYKKDWGKAFVYTFESAFAQWMGMDAAICTLAEHCGGALVMEHDGTVYSCDHFVYPKYLLGRISEQHLSTLAFSPQQESFGQSKQSSLTRQCRGCRYLFACNGECPRTRFVKTADGEAGLSYLCSGTKRYLRHIEPIMEKMKRSYHTRGQQASGSRTKS